MLQLCIENKTLCDIMWIVCMLRLSLSGKITIFLLMFAVKRLRKSGKLIQQQRWTFNLQSAAFKTFLFSSFLFSFFFLADHFCACFLVVPVYLSSSVSCGSATVTDTEAKGLQWNTLNFFPLVYLLEVEIFVADLNTLKIKTGTDPFSNIHIFM